MRTATPTHENRFPPRSRGALRLCSVLLAALLLLTSLWTASCSPSSSSDGGGAGNQGFSDTVGHKIICTAADFASLKNEWFGNRQLVSDRAVSAHQNTLVAGQEYYFVYTYNLVYEGDGYDSSLIGGNLHFTAKSWDGMYAEDEAVRIGEDLVTDGIGSANLEADGTLNMHREPNGSDVMAYVAVPFTPLHGGFLRIDSAVFDYPVTFKPLDDRQPAVCVNVVETPDRLERDLQVTVSNLTYGLISEADYESGRFEEGLSSADGSLRDLSSVSMGRNYVIVEYEVAATGADTGEVCCGIYIKNGYWTNMVLEQANTARTHKAEVEGGTMLDFVYTTPKNGTKRIRTVFSIDVLSVCSIDLEIFLYSDNTPIQGTVNQVDCFIDESASKLTYRVDTEENAAYVTGYETMTGTVIIPGSYEGYPVCGIDERAFADCAELHTLRLTHVKDLGYSAFENCTALTDVDLGDSLTVIPSAAFRGCTALTTLNVPARITTIQNEAFASCTGLSYVTFENPHTWAIAMRDKQLITMNSPEQNAELLTDTYADNSFALEPTVQVQNLSLGVVDAEAYESGNYEGSIQYSWDQTMQRGKTCYWILDLDVSYLTKAKGSVNWGVYLTCTKDYDISIHEIIGVDTECYEAHYTDDTGRYAFYVEYGEQSFEPAHVRLVLQVTPVSGNRRMSLYVSGTCIMTEHGYVADSIDFIPEMDVSVW